jgi:DNA adenine methylase
MNKTRPIIRWAGGKVWLTESIASYISNNFGDYHEPFLGGASVFLALKSSEFIKQNSFLSDANSELIETYRIIRDQPENLFNSLTGFENTKEHYYFVRSQNLQDPVAKAARFLYLNRTSFNGIYRVNLKGEYNVPYGSRKMSHLFKKEELMALSSALADVHLEVSDFGATLSYVKKGDFVFLDPPYTVAHENNGFVKYNQKIFAWQDQERLRVYIDSLNSIGAFFILTNAAHYSIKDLYDGVGKISKLERPSLIGGKGAKRDLYHEYLITNM